MPINQPANQIKHTNISIVRMRKGKKRYEIACYKNKVMEWRNGNEKELDNVLQIPNVFINVGKGQFASEQNLKDDFKLGEKSPKDGKPITRDSIILEILNHGELQVGDKERQAQLDNMRNAVIDIVASKLVDPVTKRVYTPVMIGKALDLISHQSQQQQQQLPGKDGPDEKSKPKPKWTGVMVNKPVKSQALEAMKALEAHQPIPVARARMRLRITCPISVANYIVKIKAPDQNDDDEHADEQERPKASKKSKGKAKKSMDDDGDEDEGQTVKGQTPKDVKKKSAAAHSTTVKEHILTFIEQVESQTPLDTEWDCVAFVETMSYKELTEFVATHTKGKARVEVLDTAVIYEGND